MFLPLKQRIAPLFCFLTRRLPQIHLPSVSSRLEGSSWVLREALDSLGYTQSWHCTGSSSLIVERAFFIREHGGFARSQPRFRAFCCLSMLLFPKQQHPSPFLIYRLPLHDLSVATFLISAFASSSVTTCVAEEYRACLVRQDRSLSLRSVRRL